MAELPIIVGVDGSPASLAAARHAAELADTRNAPLRLIHGYLERGGYGTATFAPYVAVPPAPSEGGERVLREAAEALRAAHPHLTVTYGQVLGGAAASLIAESSSAQLLVVGCRGLGGFTGLLLGSVSAQVVGHARCPVLVIRPSEPASPAADAPVIVGVDGSVASTTALEYAAAEAAYRKLRLQIVISGVPDGDEPARETEQLLAQARSEVRTLHPDVAVEAEARVGTDPASDLVEASRQAAMVVVGSRGRGGFTGLLLGSVSQALVHHAHCPVLVIPPKAAR